VLISSVAEISAGVRVARPPSGTLIVKSPERSGAPILLISAVIAASLLTAIDRSLRNSAWHPGLMLSKVKSRSCQMVALSQG
jgi:hypothetical protein